MTSASLRCRFDGSHTLFSPSNHSSLIRISSSKTHCNSSSLRSSNISLNSRSFSFLSFPPLYSVLSLATSLSPTLSSLSHGFPTIKAPVLSRVSAFIALVNSLYSCLIVWKWVSSSRACFSDSESGEVWDCLERRFNLRLCFWICFLRRR